VKDLLWKTFKIQQHEIHKNPAKDPADKRFEPNTTKKKKGIPMNGAPP